MQCSVIIGFTLGFLETDTTNGCGGAHSYLPSTSPSLGRLSSNSSGQMSQTRPATATPATERIRTLQIYYGLAHVW